jgi:hypothetical protein
LLFEQARAVDGMLEERDKIVSLFVFSLFCFGLSMIGTYGIMMTQIAALITSTLTVLGKYSTIFWWKVSTACP